MGELAALSASALWAVASLFFTRLSTDHGATVMNTLKCVIALLGLAATLWILEGAPFPTITTESMSVLAVSGLLGLTLGDTAFFSALTRMGPRRALLVMALVPAITALMAWPALNEQPTVPMVAGMLLTVGGVAWVIRERTPGSDDAIEAAGLGFALIAAFCQSAGSVLTKFGGAEISALGISVVRLVFGAIGLLVVLAVRGKLQDLFKPFATPKGAAALVFATFLGTYLGIWLMNAGLIYTTHAGIAATLSSTSPIFILPLAWLFLGEKLTGRSIAGAVVAMLGVALLFLL